MSGHGIDLVTGVAALAARYPIWFCDIWGVLHNGVVAFAPAVDALTRFRAGGGHVVLLTNAPRPHDDVARQVASLGITPAAYDAIVTSGDVTRALIAGYAGQGLHHIGPEKDRSLFAGLDVRLVPEADAVAAVCTGLVDDTNETPAAYSAELARLVARDLPMICANPDIVIERGNELCYCAGAIGEAYEAIGGEVAYAGKPHQPIYHEAMLRAGTILGRAPGLHDVLAIGDGMNTDILGAHKFGIDMVFVASGIHLDAGESLNAASLTRLFAARPERPVAAIAQLAW
jgi:HAD superfamily hydrolase (TIGR01459 family)